MPAGTRPLEVVGLVDRMKSTSKMNGTSKITAYLAVSFLSSFAFAICWVIVMTLTLPETDMAYGQMPFQDPLVFPIMSILATVSAFAAWPFYVILGWELSPQRVGIVSGLVTLAFIILVTPIHAGLGWLGSYGALLASLIVCRFRLKTHVINHHSSDDAAHRTDSDSGIT